MAVTFYMHDNKVVGFQNKVVSAPTITLPPTLDSVTPGDTTTTVAWTPPAGSPDSYNLYWSLTSPVTTASNKLTGVTSPYVHTGRTNGTKYFYAVTAVKGGLESVLSNELSGTPVVYLLDSVGGSFLAAVGWWKLKSTYAGQCQRLRRENDNAESDFGFSALNFDKASADAWAGANSARAVTAYDQAGSGTNWSMGVAVYQPKAYESGVIVPGAVTGKYASRHDITPLVYRGEIATVTTPWSFVLAAIDDGTNDSAMRCIFSAKESGSGPRLIHYSDTYRLLLSANGTNQITNNTAPFGTPFVAVGVFNGANSILRVNGVEVSGNTGTAIYKPLDLGWLWKGRLMVFAAQAAVWDEATRIKAESAAKFATGVTW